MILLLNICFPYSEHVCRHQVLDEEITEGHAGSLLHQHDDAGSSPLLRPRGAVPGLQEDPHQGRVEAEPRGFFQHLGP